MFETRVKDQMVYETLLPIKRSKYPALSEDEERLSIPLQTLCGAIFDAILVHMMNSIAPNLIHSLNASILCKTIDLGRKAADPITNWVAIHDSFGVHVNARNALLAPDGPLKSAFVETYAPDILADLAENFAAQLPGAQIPEPPQRGNFNIEEVRASDYFFS